MRPITAQPITPKSDAFSPQRIDTESFHGQMSTKDLELKISSKLQGEKHFNSINIKKNIDHYECSSRHISHTDSADLTKNDPFSFYTDKEDDLSVEDDADKDTSAQVPPHAKLGIGVGIGLLPINSGSTTSPLAPSDLSSIDALSSALSTLIFQEKSAASDYGEALFEERPSSQDSKIVSSEQGAPLSSLLGMNASGSDAKSNASLGASATLAQSLPAPVAMAIRTARFSDFLTELTATVDRARLNTGQDMTLQLRSDVLEQTNIHISGDATHINVVFSTANAASNTLLTSHLETLQNHLVALCPGQLVDIKMSPMPSSSSFSLGDKDDPSNDLASFDQGNRGNSRNNDDTL